MKRRAEFRGASGGICLVDSRGPRLGFVRQSLFVGFRHTNLLPGPNAISKIDVSQSGGGHEFASDNTAGICPEAWAALEKANTGEVSSYGEDQWTARVCDRIREIFETDCDVYFVFNGTAANALALAQLCSSFQSILCHERAHIQTDECGAPEFFSGGSKLILVGGQDGKIDVGQAEVLLARETDVHSHKPGAISIAQTTEFGTVYTPDDIAAIADVASAHRP